MGMVDRINSIFTGTGRYSAELQVDGTNAEVLLNIVGAVPEDGGEIGCQISSEGAETVYVKLDVVVSLTDISLYGMASSDAEEEPVEQYEDAQTVPFHEGDEYFFQCQAGGGTYPPAFSMTIGDQDITELFTTEESYELSDGQPGLRRVIYSGKATTHDPVVVTNEQNAKEFRCTAGVPGWETEALSVHIQPVLKFPPVLTCPERVGHDLYDNDVEDVSCVVKSDPPVTELEWHWVREATLKFNQTLKMNEYRGRYSHKIKDGEYPDEFVSTLYIDRAVPEVFRRYSLVAKNALGEYTAHVNLVLDNPGALVGAAQRTMTSLCLTVCVAVLAFMGL